MATTTETSAVQPSAEELRAMLATADRRTLAAVVTHLSGDPSAVPDLRDRAHIEALANELVPAFLAGQRTVAVPTEEVLLAAMSLAAGEAVPPDYGPLVREQMGFGPALDAQPLDAPAGFHVVIIGAGVTGVLAGMTLERLGLTSFTILDKNAEPGGTWWQNTYPGCRVDTPSLLYSYSFDPDPGWPEHFSHQPDLLAYVQRAVDTAAFGDRLRCGVEVTTMTWDDDADVWDLELRTADGGTDHVRANFVLSASGLLNIVRWPDIAGRDDFDGPVIHAAQWDHNVDLDGKRVAVVGTGASANQIVPAIAPRVGQLFVFQRSPHWMMSHPQYGKALAGTERWLVEHVPTYLAWYRFRQFWVFGDAVFDKIRIDPDWPHQERSVSETNDLLRAQLTEYIESELTDRPDLVEKVVPTYPPYAKRMVVDNGWYKALRRDNVQLVTAPIKRVTSTGIETTSGPVDVDVVVFATGFYTNRPLWPIQVWGRGGVDVRAELDARPEAYRGMAVAHCPNLLMTYGPHGTPAHGGNGMLFAECAVTYVVECLRAMFDHGWRRMEVKPEAVRAYRDAMAAEVEGFVFSVPGVTNWFRGERDEATAVVPKRLIEVWNESKRPDLDAYEGASA